MKIQSILSITVLMVTLTALATDEVPVSDTLPNINSGFSSMVRKESTSTLNDVNPKMTLLLDVEGATKASALNSGDLDGFRNYFRNDVTLTGPTNIDAISNQGTQSFGSQDEKISGSNQESGAFKQKEQNGRDAQKIKQGIIPDAQRPNLTNGKLEDGQNFSEISIQLRQGMQTFVKTLTEKIISFDPQHSIENIISKIQGTEDTPSEQKSLMQSSKLLDDGRIMDDLSIQNESFLLLAQSPTKACECGAKPFKKNLKQLRGLDLKKFTISDTGNTCGLDDWSKLCGSVNFKFTMGDTSQEITNFPYKGLGWDKNTLEFTLKPTTDAEAGDQIVKVNILFESFPEDNQVFTIAFKSVLLMTAQQNMQENDPKVSYGLNYQKNLDQTDVDPKTAQISATSPQASPQTSEVTAHPDLTTTAVCDPSDSTCFNSYLASAFFTDLYQCSFLDRDCIIKAASARLACLGNSECEEALTAVALKQAKIDLDLNKDLGSPADSIASRTDETHRKADSKKTVDSCECYIATLVNALTKFNDSSPYMHVGDPPIAISDREMISNACGMHDWRQLCGSMNITFKDSIKNEAIPLQFRGLSWQEHLSQFTINPTNDDLGNHSFTIVILLQNHHNLNKAIKISYKIAPRSPVRLKGRKLQDQSPTAVASGLCTGPTTNFNLLNNGVQASQSFGVQGFSINANAGCDGLIQIVNPTFTMGNIVIISAEIPNYNYWVATFATSKRIESILYLDGWSLPFAQLRVGDDDTNYYLNNPQCIGGQLTAGGWLACELSGKYFAITSTTVNGFFGFMEVMAFSQAFIQHKALSSTLSSPSTASLPYLCTTETNCQASNVLRSTIVLWYTNPLNAPPYDIVPSSGIFSTSETDPFLKVELKANVLIALVLLTPSDEFVSGGFPAPSDVTFFQTNVEIWIENSAGALQQCGGTLADYNTYTEVPCNKVGNKVIVKKPGINMTLAMAGFSILSDCDCSLSSFNPALISPYAATVTFASSTTLNTKSTDPPVIITFNTNIPDTVSSVCGTADGFTKCPRVISFKDKETGTTVTFPYKGFTWNAVTGVLKFDPTQAIGNCVLTATLSLVNYPTVLYSQDITSTFSTPAVLQSQTTSSTSSAVKVIQLMIHTQTLNATIGQEAILFLPGDIGASYIVVSNPKFQASVNQNQLKVQSISKSDVGIYLLIINVTTSNNASGNFTVKVIFTEKSNSTVRTKPKTTTITGEFLQKGSVLSTQETENLFDTVNCTTYEAGISCTDVNNSSYYLDTAQGKLVYGDIVQTSSSTEQPTLSVSNVNPLGEVYLRFDQTMNFLFLQNTTKNAARSLRAENDPSDLPENYKYLLSERHLNITIQSRNTTQPKFTWYAKNITSTEILIQLVFEEPLYISNSNDPNFLDRLQITVLPPALHYFKSLASGALTKTPLTTYTNKLPPQAIIGREIRFAEKAADILKIFGLSSTVGFLIFQIATSGVLSKIWTMVNALTIILSFTLLNVLMPGNVLVVNAYLADLANWNVFQTDKIMSSLFNFTPTDSPGVGFESMGKDSKIITLYLGAKFLIMIPIGLNYLLYSLAFMCRRYDKHLSTLEKKLRPCIAYKVLYLFLMQTYFDWAVGSPIRFEQSEFQTPSDYFDFGMACVGIVITVVFPIYCCFFLNRNFNQLDNKLFKSKHGALYEGFITEKAHQRSASMRMPAWFLLRRFLTAVNLIFLRNQTIWIQLTLNMWLSLIDVCVKIHLSPYESKLGGSMEKFNDIIVLTCAYFPYLFTDLIPSQEDKYYIGWYYSGIIGILIGANIFMLGMSSWQDSEKKVKRMIYKRKIKKVIEKRRNSRRDARRKKKEEAKKKADAKKGVGLIVAVVKPRFANQPQNRHHETRPERMALTQLQHLPHETREERIQMLQYEQRKATRKPITEAERRDLNNKLKMQIKLSDEQGKSLITIQLEEKIRKLASKSIVDLARLEQLKDQLLATKLSELKDKQQQELDNLIMSQFLEEEAILQEAEKSESVENHNTRNGHNEKVLELQELLRDLTLSEITKPERSPKVEEEFKDAQLIKYYKDVDRREQDLQLLQEQTIQKAAQVNIRARMAESEIARNYKNQRSTEIGHSIMDNDFDVLDLEQQRLPLQNANAQQPKSDTAVIQKVNPFASDGDFSFRAPEITSHLERYSSTEFYLQKMYQERVKRLGIEQKKLTKKEVEEKAAIVRATIQGWAKPITAKEAIFKLKEIGLLQ